VLTEDAVLKQARTGSRAARALLAGAVVAALLGAASPSTPVRAQVAPLAFDRGATGLALALRRLPVAASVLLVTAHPDDEDNGLLVLLSRGRGLRTGLLTLTRGQGGQNEVGPELFEALAVLRTEELAAVHRYDGVEQMFGRAVDFGYSFSVEETFERWGREEALGDVVRAVRAFRPDVMLTLPLESEGGGQHHQAAARLAREAFRAAADPARFPEQVAAGLPPWQPRKIYQGGVGGGRLELDGAPPVVVPTGLHDPVIGLSPYELGAIARAQHRSQAQVRLKPDPLEGRATYFLVDSEPAVTGPESDLLDGIDVSLSSLARFAQDEAGVPSLRDELAALQKQVGAARDAFDPARPDLALPSLAEALKTVRAILETVRGSGLGEAARYELTFRLEAKERQILDAIALAAGVGFEVLARDDEVVPGQSLGVTAKLWNRADRPLQVDGVSLAVPHGWTVRPGEAGARVLAPWTGATLEFEVSV
jgi:LmbE family N-acetylglucosaminyl deacetylase